MLDVCLVILFACHLLCVNVASAAPLVCPYFKRRAGRGEPMAGIVGLWLARQSVWALVWGTGFGAATLGLMSVGGHDDFFQALAVIPRRRLWFGLAELLFFFVCMRLYLWSWRWSEGAAWKGFLHACLAWLAATDLLYHFPPLFAAVSAIRSRPELFGQELGYRQILEIMAGRTVAAPVLHFVLASFAVTGTWMIVLSLRIQSDIVPSPASRIGVWGARLALASSVVQLLVGLWVLVELPADQRDRLLGGDLLATLLFAASGLAILSLFHHLAAVALGDDQRSAARRAIGLMILVVVMMVAARHAALSLVGVHQSLIEFDRC